MKKQVHIFSTLIALLLCFRSTAQTFTTVTIQDSISTNTTWTCDKQYLLKGYVYVTSGTTLTIDPGVIIRGDKNTKGALIIERGAKIMALGTAASPIVFTSSQPAGQRSYGDWGGVILCGKSPVNWTAGQAQVEGGPRSLYGGTDPADNSGTMQYVRIEFPGIAFSPNNEVNGLTFCGVGTGTTIDHIQVSYSGDDSYEWFGGTVNTKYIVAYKGWDDDFDTDNGYNGNNQYGIALRDPFAADQSGSKCFESDSYQAGTATGLAGDTSQITKPVFSNFTCIGPLVSPTSTSYDPQYVSAVHIRRGSAISIMNSIIAGYPCGVLVDESAATFGSTVANIQSGILQFKNNVVCGIPNAAPLGSKEVFYVINGARSLTPTTTWADTTTGTPFGTYGGPMGWMKNPANSNWLKANEQNGVKLQNPFNQTGTPDFLPTSISGVIYNSAGHTFNTNNPINLDTTGSYANYNAPDFIPSYSSYKLQNPFFHAENHIGAMNNTGNVSDKWTSGWCNWDPNNTNYEVVCSATAVPEYSVSDLYLKVSPNPVTADGILGYTLATDSKIDVSLFNMMGEKVETLYNNANQSKGSYIYRFNTQNLVSGVYTIVVTTNNTMKTIKIAVKK